jgi:serine protease Do
MVMSEQSPVHSQPSAPDQVALHKRPPTFRSSLLAGVAVLALAAGGVGLHAINGQAANSAPAGNLSAAAPSVAMPSFADLVEGVRHAVVSIKVSAVQASDFGSSDGANPFEGSPFERFFRDMPRGNGSPFGGPRGAQPMLQGQGSGFLISADGYIVTNNHVVQNAVKVEVVMDDGKTVAAKVIGTDPKTDVALLKIDHGSNLPHVTFSDATPRVGEWVVAMGNPFGLGGTVTAGIVSAQGRDIGSGPFDNYIQIDAPVNRGNSGGPTFNMSGQVIGVNTAIYSPTGGSVGIAFDIPAATVKSVVADLKANGRVERGWLGVEIQPVTADVADSLGMKEAAGALVAGVQPQSPAAKAGLASGDVIAEVDGTAIKDARDLARSIGAAKPGKTVKITVQRAGKTQTMSVKLDRMEAKPVQRS